MKMRYISLLVLILISGISINHFGWNEIVDKADSLSGHRIPREWKQMILVGENEAETESTNDGFLLPGGRDCETRNGLRVKVITTQAGVRCTRTPKGNDLTGAPLPLFTELFVLTSDRSGEKPDWFGVSTSPRASDSIGYVDSALVKVWPTRMADHPIQTVAVYASRAEAEQLARTGRTTGDPIAIIPADQAREYLPWPIVESYPVTNQHGLVVEVEKIAFLGISGNSSHQTTHRPTVQKILKQLEKMAVVFCVDNTRSTEPFLSSICGFISNFADQFSKDSSEMLFGLTLYRDDVEGLRWNNEEDGVSRSAWRGGMKSRAEFLSTVENFRVPNVGSEDWPECGLQGLLTAVNKSQWPSLAHPTIIWIGDNSFHEYGTRKNQTVSVNAVVSAARKKGITIHAVCIEGGGDLAEQQTHLQQCQAISRATGGKVFQLDDLQGIVREICSAMDCESNDHQANKNDLDRWVHGRLGGQDFEFSRFDFATASSDRQRRYRMAQLLKQSGFSISDLQANQPTFSEGWVATQLPGQQPHFERQVYVSRLELDFLMAELNNMVAVLNLDSTDDVFELFRIGIGSRVGDHSFFSNSRTREVGFDAFVAGKKIPMRTGITSKTRAELLAMSREDKMLLRRKLVREIIPRLGQARSSDSFAVDGSFDFGWIPERLLP